METPTPQEEDPLSPKWKYVMSGEPLSGCIRNAMNTLVEWEQDIKPEDFKF